MKWSDKDASRRLLVLVGQVPAPTGFGTQSATVTGLANYSADMRPFTRVLRAVLTATACPAPDPEFGDDGYRDEMRRDALEALDWAEAWVLWRNENNWQRCLCDFLERPWERG
jgi:hypothetical protein